MKKGILIAFIAALFATICLVSPSCGRSAAKGPDTLKINTTNIGAQYFGYGGPCPVEISVFQGKIAKIVALPNDETPRFFQRVLDSGLLERLNGLTVEEARTVKLDAVSGATYSSTAIIENIRLGLEQVK